MTRSIKLSLTLVFVFACSAVALAEGGDKGAVTLDVKAGDVKKVEANQTLIGYSHTKIFYTLAGQGAVVVIQVDNTDKKFPVTCKVHRFAKGVAGGDLEKWVNNQHSDGLFPEVPEPVETHALPAKAVKTVSSKLQGQVKAGPEDVAYDKYAVEFAVDATELGKNLKLSAFKDAATVYLKAAGAKSSFSEAKE